MSLDYALEKYPAPVKLRDGTPCVLRPLGRRDVAKLHRFFGVVPEEERLFIKQSVQDRALFEQWCRHLDYEKNLPLLMLDRATIVGEATLHQREGGWRRHIGVVTVLTHPGYRGRDVAKILVSDVIEIARHLGLQRLEARLNGERTVAIRALEWLGFRTLMRLPDYVVDMQSRPHDYVFMGLDLRTEEDYTSAE